jgi:prepilin-type N-terminal cleavage/methylation domain-containing protein
VSTQTAKPVPCRAPTRPDRGFSLVELMITLTMLAVTVVVIMTVMYTASRSKTSTSNRVESAQAARVAMDLIANDLRSAGYRADLDWTAQPQPPIAYIDSLQVLMNANLLPYPDTAAAGPRSPLAYAPTGSPKPFPLNGTSWPAIFILPFGGT